MSRNTFLLCIVTRIVVCFKVASPTSSPFVFPHQKSQDQAPDNLQKICEEMHRMKNKQVLKENYLKSFLQKSGRVYFLVLTNR